VDSEFLSQLNEQQREAVLATEGPLLILAGAGSGKTRVIAHRIAYLIAEKKVPSWNILAVTFTNKAADEMRQRVQRLLHTQNRNELPLVSTFHSLCVRILRQDIEKLNDRYTRRFTIYDQDDSIRLIKQCIREVGFDEKYLAPRATQSAISSAKNRGEDPAAFAALVLILRARPHGEDLRDVRGAITRQQRARFRRPADQSCATAARRT
jgi:DNA helicase-2/ATP-dependent DNA helicase PcrA